MAKFKVGESVKVCKSPYASIVPGDVVEVLATGVRARRGDIRVQRGMDIDLTFYADELEKVEPKPPKPKTIPARNLSGKHIGRVVTVTSESGNLCVTAEVVEVLQKSLETLILVKNDDLAVQTYVHTNPDSKVTLS